MTLPDDSPPQFSVLLKQATMLIARLEVATYTSNDARIRNAPGALQRIIGSRVDTINLLWSVGKKSSAVTEIEKLQRVIQLGESKILSWFKECNCSIPPSTLRRVEEYVTTSRNNYFV